MPYPIAVLILWFGLLCVSPSATATPIVLGDDSSGSLLNGQAQLLEDVGGRLQLQDILSPAVQQRFQPGNGRTSVGQSRNPWWIKLQLSGNRRADWWLEVGAVTQLDLQLFLPDDAGHWQARQAGERVSFAQGRDYPYRRMLFQLPPLDAQPITLYLRSYDPAGNSFPLQAWQLSDLQQQASVENLGLGLIYGVILALLLYNLFILLSLRDRAYLWYVLTTATSLLFILSMSGHGFQYLWPQGPVPLWLDRISLPILVSLCILRFAQELLYTRQSLRRAHRLLNASAVLYLLALAGNLAGYRGESAILIDLIPLISVPTLLFCAVIRWRQGFFPALLYLIGYGSVLVSFIILVLRAAGVVQPSNATAYLYPVAVAAESILFSFALAYRIQILKQEKAVAQEQANQEKTARLNQAQAAAAQLQTAVSERTAELAAANQRLSEREQELKHAAFHDPLTELANRRYLLERIEAALADAQRRGEVVALMLLDLDHFKPINDQYGHAAGDWVLQTLAQRLREHVRGNDLVARLGGDEFAVLIGGADAEEQAREIAQRLLAELAKPMSYDQAQLCVNTSIGVALYPHHAQHLADLYKAADDALYQAKARGRCGVALYGTDDATGNADGVRQTP